MLPTSLKSAPSTTNAVFFPPSTLCTHTHIKNQTMLLPCHHAANMNLICLVLFWLSVATNTLGQITAAPSCPTQADPWYSHHGLLVQKRDIRTYCDSSSKCKSTNLSRSLSGITYRDLVYCYAPAACVSGSDGCACFLPPRVHYH